MPARASTLLLCHLGGALSATLCLDANFEDLDSNGNPNVKIWDCDNSNSNQQFFTHDVGDRTISMEDPHNPDDWYCLDNSNYGDNGAMTNGNPVVMWPCNGELNQQWAFVYSEDLPGKSKLAAWTMDDTGISDKCLDADDMKVGNPLMIWDCNGQSQQSFGSDEHTSGSDATTVYLADSRRLGVYV